MISSNECEFYFTLLLFLPYQCSLRVCVSVTQNVPSGLNIGSQSKRLTWWDIWKQELTKLNKTLKITRLWVCWKKLSCLLLHQNVFNIKHLLNLEENPKHLHLHTSSRQHSNIFKVILKDFFLLFFFFQRKQTNITVSTLFWAKMNTSLFYLNVLYSLFLKA